MRTKTFAAIILVWVLVACYPLALHAKTRVAVMELGVKTGVKAETAAVLTDTLRTTLYGSGIFEMLNREDMVDILGEVKFQQSGACEETSCIVEMGGSLGVEKMVAGSIGLIGKKYSVTIKLVDIAKAKNDVILTDYYKGKLEGMPEFIERMAEELVENVLREKDIKRHSAKKAAILGIVPGLGHWYNGRNDEALKFALLGGTMAAGVVLFTLEAGRADDKYEEEVVQGGRSDFEFLATDADESRSYRLMFIGGLAAVVCWSSLDCYLTGKGLEGKVEITSVNDGMEVGYALKF